ncbi:hypothetical protein Tco_0291090 [Tanacetum coccineum]
MALIGAELPDNLRWREVVYHCSHLLTMEDCANHLLRCRGGPISSDSFKQRHLDLTAGGTFMKRRPEECYDLIENMTAHHNDWDTSAQRNESSSSITSSNPEIASLKLQMEEMNRNLTRVLQTNQQVNTVTPSCETCGGPHSYNDCPATVGQNQNVYAVGAYNQGGNSYQPQGNRNLLSYRSDNYLGPPGFNVNQNQNRSNQNQNNQVQPYQNRNQGNNQSNNQGRNQFFQSANHNQNQVQNYKAPNTQPPVALPQELTKYIRINENKINSMQTQMNNLATSNQRLESMLGNFIKMNTASSLGMGSLPSNTVANPKGELKAITTRSGLVLDEPSVPIPPPFINPKEDERAEETFTNSKHGNDDLPFNVESDLLELDYLLNHDPIKDIDSILEDSVDENSLDDNLDDTISEMFTDEHALDYSSPPLWDDYDDNLFDHETVNDDTYDDPFYSKEEKIKDSKILIDELDPPESSDFLPFPECDSVFYEDFSKVDALSSTNNEDKDFNPPLYELPFHKEVSGLGALLSFSSENKKKIFNPGILTSKRVHTSLLSKLSHRGTKAFKVTKNLESLMEIFPCSYQEDIRDCSDFKASRARSFCPLITRASNPKLHFGNPIS